MDHELGGRRLPLVDLFWRFVVFFALLVFSWLVITVFGDLYGGTTCRGGPRPAGSSWCSSSR
ncbi:hypothetical protein [Geodermatophilus sp. SYSU D00696]